MPESPDQPASESNIQEIREWLDSIDYVIKSDGPGRALELLEKLKAHLRQRGVNVPSPMKPATKRLAGAR